MVKKIKVTLPDNPRDKAWGMDHGDFERVKRTRDGITIKFPAGGYASSNGVNIKGSPTPFPSTDMTIRYKVFVPEDFDWVKGGKLPGLIWAGGAGGRSWKKGGSARVMWRRGGTIVGYLYLSTTVGSYDGTPNNPLMRRQHPDFNKIVHHTNGAGLDIWRHEKKTLSLKRGEWNTIKMRVKMNSKDTADGVLSLRVNKDKKRFKGIMFVDDPQKIPLEGIQLSSWFGGGSKDYAPKKDQELVFKRFTLLSRLRKLFQ